MTIIRDRDQWERHDKSFPAYWGHPRQCPENFPVCVTEEEFRDDNRGPFYYEFFCFEVEEVEINGEKRFVIAKKEIL